MSITVKQLILKLKEFPPQSLVGVRAHDNNENELAGHVVSVDKFDPEQSFDKEFCKNTFVVLNG